MDITDVSKLWRGDSATCGEVTKAVARLLWQFVARLPNLWRDYLWQNYLVTRLLSSRSIHLILSMTVKVCI